MQTSHFRMGYRNDQKELVVAIDDIPVSIEKRPAPPVTEYLAKRMRWFCQRCVNLGSPVVMQDCLEIDEPSQILKLKYGHHRNAVIRVIGA